MSVPPSVQAWEALTATSTPQEVQTAGDGMKAEVLRLREALQHIVAHTNCYANEWHVARAALELVPPSKEPDGG